MTVGGRYHCCYSYIYRVENWDPKREGGGVRIQTQAGSWVCVSNHCPFLLLVELPHSIMNSIILQYKKNWCCLGGVSKPHREASQRHVAPKNSPEGCVGLPHWRWGERSAGSETAHAKVLEVSWDGSWYYFDGSFTHHDGTYYFETKKLDEITISLLIHSSLFDVYF